MGRLTSLKPRITKLPSRFAGQDISDRQQYSRERDRSQPWRAWYKTARWQKLRLEILLRDQYRCQKTGVLLYGKYPAENSPVIDHKIPHRGDEALFWDENNLQSLSKAYHDSDKQKQERWSY